MERQKYLVNDFIIYVTTYNKVTDKQKIKYRKGDKLYNYSFDDWIPNDNKIAHII